MPAPKNEENSTRLTGINFARERELFIILYLLKKETHLSHVPSYIIKNKTAGRSLLYLFYNQPIIFFLAFADQHAAFGEQFRR